ncbi:NADH-quinone oxidoreductase subunit C [Saccharolobus islandicus]|uniref:NADH (Or F420H2) dehydrogenase, subunit C n=1 Tax=Saccharolobus islandicus (strain L.D.8.5 / Lassen \|nr:NADH-quinone oxidoreductase subunit C [Sulfolobus islandicus]ADB87690.1 NADH (or F420H2) dehydrogenase, subunit C [Sulfolobus islandicus L.D.8.5]
MSEALKSLINDLQTKFKCQAKIENDRRITVIVPDKKIMKDVANHLKNFGFDHVKAVTGIDYLEQEKLEVVYHISSYSNLDMAKIILALRITVTYKDPSLPSLYSIFESAWTGERETYEMLGIRFEGHPDLRRFFLDEDFEGVYPLRKSFKIKLEGIFVDKPTTE